MSPTPVKANAMEFGDAMREVVRGCRVTRGEWNSRDVVFLIGGVLHIKIAEDQPDAGLKAGTHKFLVSDGDLSATDWQIAPMER